MGEKPLLQVLPFNKEAFKGKTLCCRPLPFEREGSGGIYSCIRKELTEAVIFMLDRCGLLYLPAGSETVFRLKT